MILVVCVILSLGNWHNVADMNISRHLMRYKQTESSFLVVLLCSYESFDGLGNSRPTVELFVTDVATFGH